MNDEALVETLAQGDGIRPSVLHRGDYQPYYVAWCLIVHGKEPGTFTHKNYEFMEWIRDQWADLREELGFDMSRSHLHADDMLNRLAALVVEDPPTHYDPSSLALCAGCAHAGRFHLAEKVAATRVIVETDIPCEHGITGRNHNIMEGAYVVAECIFGTEVRQLGPQEVLITEGGCVADGCDCRKWVPA